MYEIENYQCAYKDFVTTLFVCWTATAKMETKHKLRKIRVLFFDNKSE